jgi:hypothetical protein
VLEASLVVEDLARFLRYRMGAVLKALRSVDADGWYLSLLAWDEEATFYETNRLDSFGARIPQRLRGCVRFIRMGPSTAALSGLARLGRAQISLREVSRIVGTATRRTVQRA